jgi:hypothetical protein
MLTTTILIQNNNQNIIKKIIEGKSYKEVGRKMAVVFFFKIERDCSVLFSFLTENGLYFK